MTIRSEPMRDGQPVKARPARSTDWTLALGRLGAWLAVIAFGSVFWAINGGFSVAGLPIVAGAFNDAGRIFWAGMEAIRFSVPISVPGIPTDQPLLPWIGVVAASLLQVVILYRTLRGLPIPLWMWLTAAALSVYDYTTTYFGLGTVVWIAQAGMIVQGVLTFILTFIVEGIVGLLLKR